MCIGPPNKNKAEQVAKFLISYDQEKRWNGSIVGKKCTKFNETKEVFGHIPETKKPDKILSAKNDCKSTNFNNPVSVGFSQAEKNLRSNAANGMPVGGEYNINLKDFESQESKDSWRKKMIRKEPVPKFNSQAYNPPTWGAGGSHSNSVQRKGKLIGGTVENFAKKVCNVGCNEGLIKS
jgi:hypothetical protein